MRIRTSLCIALALAATTAAVASAQTKPAAGAAKSAPSAMPATQAAAKSAPSVATATTPPAAPAAAVAVPTDYVIGPEDMLQITVWKNDTLSKAVPVRPDGKISLPLLHDIQAAGLTAMQLRDKIAGALAEFMPNPEVSVIVSDVRSFRVSVLGEVQRPGVLQLRSDTSILEAIAMSGGFRDFASPSKIIIFRKDSYGNTHKLSFNYNRAMRGQEDNLALKSGDVIVVP
jgi:polysaccharide export outer membrane protein